MRRRDHRVRAPRRPHDADPPRGSGGRPWNPLIHEYAARLAIIRTQAREAVRGLDADALNWTPTAEETNSAAALVHHMWGLERFFVRQVVGGHDIGRDRDAEFAAQAATAEELVRLLDEAQK